MHLKVALVPRDITWPKHRVALVIGVAGMTSALDAIWRAGAVAIIPSARVEVSLAPAAHHPTLSSLVSSPGISIISPGMVVPATVPLST